MSQQAPAALTDLKALTRPELERWVVEELGAPRFRADQLFGWIHARRVRSFEAMTNLSKPLRAKLGATARLGGLRLDDVRRAADGTRKLLFTAAQGDRVEAVLIPMEDRLTLCVSSQVGCKVGCAFCLTGRMERRRDLSASEIVDQVYHALDVVEEGARPRALSVRDAVGAAATGPDAPDQDGAPERLVNIVYMGMGEPLHNYENVVASLRNLIDPKGQDFSGRRITVSTSGVVSRLPSLGRDVPVNLAVSLNASYDAQRDQLIPINRKWPIERLVAALHAFPLAPRRRITVEYVLLAGVNDSDDDARRVARLLRGLRCKVNLIPFNPFPEVDFQRPSDARVEAFGAILRAARYTVTVRRSKGQDIGAACGQLDALPAAQGGVQDVPKARAVAGADGPSRSDPSNGGALEGAPVVVVS